jgi:hypothetical protein
MYCLIVLPFLLQYLTNGQQARIIKYIYLHYFNHEIKAEWQNKMSSKYYDITLIFKWMLLFYYCSLLSWYVIL